MKCWRQTAAVTLGLVTALVVQAASAKSLVYRTQNLFGLPNCTMKVSIAGNSIHYIPASYTRTKFSGFWPDKEGEVFMKQSELSREQRDLLGLNHEPRELVDESGYETLTIRFAKDEKGQLEPVGYTYEDRRFKGTIDGAWQRRSGPMSCSGLILISEK